MKLSSFSVSNYRSITKAHKIKTNNLTTLVGKNNEGKSNILHALSIAMEVMKEYVINHRFLTSPRLIKHLYQWERDYPVSLQERHPNKFSTIDFEFELSDREIQEIRNATGTRLNSKLPIRVLINGVEAKIVIPKKGTPALGTAENKQKVIDFVCGKIDFNFIPAVRTDQEALRVIESLIDKELLTLETSSEYIQALDTIATLQQNILDNISNRITAPLQEFLPSVSDVHIHIQKERRRAALRRNIEVMINDGAPTPLQLKGDGIKSLTALAMLNIENQEGQVSIIAIEEPESHLHPESARQLHQTITALSTSHQVILTTHSPLFINRTTLNENIIVASGKATPAKRIAEIRNVLGTQVSDNLINAEFVLLVEGEDDKIVLEKLLSNMSITIRKALSSGRLIVDYMCGAGNLTYKLSFYQSIQCKYHVLLDNDDAGRLASEKSQREGFLTTANTTLTICNGAPNAELEDCFEKDAYSAVVLDKFGVNLNCSEFRGHEKWSDRLSNCFRSQGKPWSDSVEKKVKFEVATGLPEDPQQALNSHKRSAIDALASAVERMIG